MEYRRLGDTGLNVSRLALGAMTFGKGAPDANPNVYKVDGGGAEALVRPAHDIVATLREIGASSSKQRADKLGAMSLTLGEEELSRLNSMSEIQQPYPNWFSAVAFDPLVRKARNDGK